MEQGKNASGTRKMQRDGSGRGGEREREREREREKRCVIPPQGLFRASKFSGVASVSIRGRKGDSNGREASGA